MNNKWIIMINTNKIFLLNYVILNSIYNNKKKKNNNNKSNITNKWISKIIFNSKKK